MCWIESKENDGFGIIYLKKKTYFNYCHYKVYLNQYDLHLGWVCGTSLGSVYRHLT